MRSYSVYKNSAVAGKLLTIKEEMSRLKVKVNQPSSSSTDSQFQFSQAPEVVIRREFQINGHIGELGRKDKLSYTNLMHQIETGKRQNEVEIVEAVVRAANPQLSLRDMLESENNLGHLKTILKAHFKEDITTDMINLMAC